MRRLSELACVPGALLFYESPHRAAASLQAIAQVFPKRRVALCRELTKLHEEVLRDKAPALLETVLARGEMRGEMVIVVAPPDSDEMTGITVQVDAPDQQELLAKDIACALEADEPASAIAKRLSQKYSLRKREVYARVLAMQEKQNAVAH